MRTVAGDVQLETLLGCRAVGELGYAWIQGRSPGAEPRGDYDEEAGDEHGRIPVLVARLDDVLHAFWGEYPGDPEDPEPVLRASRVGLPSWPLPGDATPPLSPSPVRVCQLAWREGPAGERVLAGDGPDGRPVFEVGVAPRRETAAVRLSLDGGAARPGERTEARLRVPRATTRLHLVLLDAAAWLVHDLRVGELSLVEPGTPLSGSTFSVHVMTELRWEGRPVCAAPGADVRLEAEYVGARPDGARLRAVLVGRATAAEHGRPRVVARILRGEDDDAPGEPTRPSPPGGEAWRADLGRDST